jgi:hypothetical protein
VDGHPLRRGPTGHGAAGTTPSIWELPWRQAWGADSARYAEFAALLRRVPKFAEQLEALGEGTLFVPSNAAVRARSSWIDRMRPVQLAQLLLCARPCPFARGWRGIPCLPRVSAAP